MNKIWIHYKGYVITKETLKNSERKVHWTKGFSLVNVRDVDQAKFQIDKLTEDRFEY